MKRTMMPREDMIEFLIYEYIGDLYPDDTQEELHTLRQAEIDKITDNLNKKTDLELHEDIWSRWLE
jgi:hypothetical protein